MRWVYKKPDNCPTEFYKTIGGHPLVANVLWQHGIRSSSDALQFLDPEQYTPSSPFDFPQMRQAILITKAAIDARQPILVWGDFDVDGLTATAILVSALNRIGANVSYHVPIRGYETHGINTTLLKEYITQGVKLLITCDTGITANDAVELAIKEGLKVILTDHHQPGATLPDSDAIINPVLLPPMHLAASLPGVGVAFKFVEALNKTYESKLNTESYLDLVALGIVADVAILKSDTRYLLQKGLIALRNTDRIGLQSVFHKSDLEQNNITSQMIGFQIAPRLNAIGRLADANNVVELLLTNDQTQAEIIATEIEGTNIQRRMLGKQIYDSAHAMLMATPDLRYEPMIIIHNPNWPAGVIGTVAGQLAQKFNKPTIILTGTQGTCKGSARSIEGINIIEAISSQAHLLDNFGGHPMAAGLSMPLDNLPLFRNEINQFIQEHYADIDLTPELEISWEFSLPDLNLDLIRDFERLAPFGNGNPQPVIVSHGLSIASVNEIGLELEHRKIALQDDAGNTKDVLWWNGACEELPNGKFDLAYHLSTSNYKGQEQINLEWVDAKIVEVIAIETTKYHLVDLRHSTAPLTDLAKFISQFPQALIWAETSFPIGYQTFDRDSLVRCGQLILWEMPSSSQLLQQILKKVNPTTVFVFSQGGKHQTLEQLLRAISAMVKFALSNKEGVLVLKEMEIGLGLPLPLIMSSLTWLKEYGAFQFTSVNKNVMQILPGIDTRGAKFAEASKCLQSSWDEHQKYLVYINITPLDKVFS